MLKACYLPYTLHFKQPAGTSRGILLEKQTYFVKIWDTRHPESYGLGECALFRGLSADDVPDYEQKLQEICTNIHLFSPEEIQGWSSIVFGIETALNDLQTGGIRQPFPSLFSQGKQAIEINGLVWMGNKTEMLQRIEQKLQDGFHCIKLKIGAINFEEELMLLQSIRSRFSPQEIELRVDANGAFTPRDAMSKLEQLARYDIHSIEQPIRQGQWQEMQNLCKQSPVPIALDEELIGVTNTEEKIALLECIHPSYIILKPSLAGGFRGSREWIELAQSRGIKWWITSALESNVGLNAIAQWTSTLQTDMPQGLGTGQLYTNNIPSPLTQTGSKLQYDPRGEWDFSFLKW